MLVTLATPALAGAPARSSLTPFTPETGQGKFTAQQTHNDELKVTIVLKGALPNTVYSALVWYNTVPNPPSEGGSSYIGDIQTDDNGNCRVRILDPGWEGPATLYVQLELIVDPYGTPATAYKSGAPIIELK